MAMIPCKECGQRISDLATRCPVCGAPTSTSDVQASKSGPRRWWAPLLVIWLIAVVSWFLVSSRGRAELMSVFGRDRQGTPVATTNMAAAVPSAPTARAVSSSVYETTAEQLFQDYSANAVAIQNKVSGHRIRIRGFIAAIDEDPAGHALVRLRTSPSASVDFRLNDDQRAAAAQLVKGQAINVECASLQHGVMSPLAFGCNLVPLETSAKPSYLALLYTEEHGQSPLYVVGPIPESTCADRAERIAGQLASGTRVLSKKCAATAQESMPAGDCRLDTSMSSLPDMPDAHLWRYNCSTHTVLARSTEKSSRKAVASAVFTADRAAAAPAAEPVVDVATTAPLVTATTQVTSTNDPAHVVSASSREEPTPVPDPATVAASTTPNAVTPSVVTAGAATPGASTPGASPAAVVVATPAPTSVTPDAAAPPVKEVAALPPDLATVGSKDPAAANRINSYCSNATAAAANKDAVALGCRREEIAAWNRFAVQNEFPSLDDAARQKCSQPPFPDSYVAKEACAKYQLRLN